ncbi:phosphonate metabolism protein PhnP [Desulfosediminicola ganghwensis]|uniref:phosphonate metabolism protein PhnP n=1 Tax=Desulfosediminicola ganghwensis TaxID=2569540 RepID=UPI0010AC9C90|nr:phosphonate metabolism protein PhnP [Desulfosediminicola ganghwensis]
MQLAFLGTGNCAGIPVYGCDCQVCSDSRNNPELKRGSLCARINTGGQTILIDAGIPYLGEICPADQIDAILLSHYHIDHVMGLFPMRWGVRDEQIAVLGPDDPDGCADLHKHNGIFDFSRTLQPFETVRIADLEVTTVALNHSRPSLGFCLSTADARLAWLADTSGLPTETVQFLQSFQPEIIILDCTFPPLEQAHQSHNDINAALAIHENVGPYQTYLAHIDHTLDLWLRKNPDALPENVHVARDFMTLSL